MSKRPAFLDQLADTYGLRRKNVALLTGDVYGLFHSPKADEFLNLEPLLVQELRDKFHLIRLDLAAGLHFYDPATEAEVVRICESTNGIHTPSARKKALKALIDNCRFNPLSALVLLTGMMEAFERVRLQEPDIKPLCCVFQFAGAMFPPGDFGRLSELDRQQLICFLGWITGPLFANSPHLLLLVNPVKSEVNDKITGLPNVAHLEIGLPDEKARAGFVRAFGTDSTLRFGGGRARFVSDTAGLSLNHIKDLMEMASRSRRMLTPDHVVAEVNTLLQAQLGNIIRIKYPTHLPKDIIGHAQAGTIFTDLFTRCDDPETAVAAMLVSGPNGSGKTFQLEAYAAASGRVVIELAGIRGSYFGETDKFFELLRWHIATFGKILILVDEAHTAFGSIHAANTHQTEQRLAGNIIKMMGNPHYLGKVLWGLMTSRPDALDPDIKSRAPIQVPIFDPEGEPRTAFVREIFARKGIPLQTEEEQAVMEATGYYSARDYRNFVAEVLAAKRKEPERTALSVLSGWQASRSIKKVREYQEVIAARHCSYPGLLPQKYRDLDDQELGRLLQQLQEA